MYFYAEEGGTPTPYMGAHCRHLVNTISHSESLASDIKRYQNVRLAGAVVKLRALFSEHLHVSCTHLLNCMIGPSLGGCRLWVFPKLGFSTVCLR